MAHVVVVVVFYCFFVLYISKMTIFNGEVFLILFLINIVFCCRRQPRCARRPSLATTLSSPSFVVGFLFFSKCDGRIPSSVVEYE